MVLLLRWSYYQGGPITEVVLLPRWSYYRGGPITEVVLLPRWSCYRGVPITDVVLLQRYSLTKVVQLLRYVSPYQGHAIVGVLLVTGSSGVVTSFRVHHSSETQYPHVQPCGGCYESEKVDHASNPSGVGGGETYLLFKTQVTCSRWSYY